MCLIHQPEILQLHGTWPDAVDAARTATERFQRLQRARHPAAGSALYQQAELHRIRGEFDAAEDAYSGASIGWGREPRPASGRGCGGPRASPTSPTRPSAGPSRNHRTVPRRSRLLAAHIEIVLAAGDVAAAKVAADELGRRSPPTSTPRCCTRSRAHATGASCSPPVTPARRLLALRTAWAAWHALDVPYEAARVRVLLGLRLPGARR